MEQTPLLSPAPETVHTPDATSAEIQKRRLSVVVVVGAALLLSGAVIKSARNKSLGARSVTTALETIQDGEELNTVPVHVQQIEAKNATHAAVVVTMPPLTKRVRTESMLMDFVDQHITPDVADIMVDLYNNDGVSIFYIDDCTFFEERSYLEKALEWNDDYALKIKLRNGVRSDIQLGTIGETDGKIQEDKYQALADQAEMLFEQYRLPAEDLLGYNPELVRLILRKEIRIEPLSQKSKEKSSDAYANPNHTPEQIRAFLHEKAKEWQNVVIVSGQPDRIAEAIQAFNAEKGPAFSAAIVTPDRPSPAVKGGDDIATRNHP